MSSRPLEYMRIVVTRAEGRADGLVERLRALGAEPLRYATIAYGPPADTTSLAAAIARLADGGYDWLVLTSATAVEAVAEQLTIADCRLQIADCPSNLQSAAVGSATAAACRELLGLLPAVVPARFVAKELAAALGDLRGQRVLLPNADIAPPTLEEALRAAGATVERVLAYRTLPASGDGLDMAAMLAAGQVEVLTFTSGSTARAFVERVGAASLPHANRCIIACIGPSTAEVARAAGLVPTVVAAVSTEAGLVDALVDYCTADRIWGARVGGRMAGRT